ncbi:ABC transporter permease [Jannaschia ovalis]|uniref:ABC transporter permease n=1 Tax=Jannaschia ovalis TaxID=3038773 RepID=A0ABY8LIS0_9RHOB|nr:ABC transporter permease [Jannaschia sp. GRR-S6-38]WGH80310.1 ABC transporter permease [Jannaschia sp. GRR-S6-38]
MFRQHRRQTMWGAAFRMADLIFHATVRQTKKGHRSGLMALGMATLQTAIFVGAFWLMFSILGLRGIAIRGNFVLFLLSGIFLFLTHTKAVGAVSSAESSTSPMMLHGPMNTYVSIAAAALSCLYLQTFSMLIVLFFTHVALEPVVITDPAQAALMFILAWFTGCAIGLCFLALKPWFPNFCSIGSSIYQRMNMIASGKMFVANTLSATMLSFFSWNPLFHTIDQARGFTFVNYNPHYTSWQYALIVGVVLLVLGMMGEHFSRKHTSISWFATR